MGRKEREREGRREREKEREREKKGEKEREKHTQGPDHNLSHQPPQVGVHPNNTGGDPHKPQMGPTTTQVRPTRPITPYQSQGIH